MFGRTPASTHWVLEEAVTAKSISRHCQVSLGGQNRELVAEAKEAEMKMSLFFWQLRPSGNSVALKLVGMMPSMQSEWHEHFLNHKHLENVKLFTKG